MIRLFVFGLSLVTLILGCAASKDVGQHEERVKRLARSAAGEIKKAMVSVNPKTFRSLGDDQLHGIPDAVNQGNQSAVSEFEETVIACSEVLHSYEKKANTYTITRIFLGAVGAVAGGVVVPALTAAAPLANSAAISSLGGVSGVTNGVLGGLSEGGLTAADTLLARARTRDSVLQALNEYYEAIKAAKPIDAGIALDKARAACTLYEVTVPAKGD